MKTPQSGTFKKMIYQQGNIFNYNNISKNPERIWVLE